jgi:hypothetical protein
VGEEEEEEADGKVPIEVADPVLPSDDQQKTTMSAMRQYQATAPSMGLISQVAQTLCFCQK